MPSKEVIDEKLLKELNDTMFRDERGTMQVGDIVYYAHNPTLRKWRLNAWRGEIPPSFRNYKLIAFTDYGGGMQSEEMWVFRKIENA